MRTSLPSVLALLVAVTIAASAAACSSETTATKASQTAPTEPVVPEEGAIPPSATPPLGETIDPQITSTLKAGGVDVTKLGDLDDIIADRDKLHAVMTSFTIALGTTCTGCHASAGKQIDYEAATPKKNVAKKMWSEFVRGLQKKDGGAIFCDSCHQGKMEFLDRTDERSLRAWMTENFVGKLARVDGKEQSCTSCHGDPFNGDFLDAWSK